MVRPRIEGEAPSEGPVIPRLRGIKVVGSYDHVKRALRSRGLAPAQHDTESEPIIGGTLITLDDPMHPRRRQLHARLFTPSALDDYEESVLNPAIDERVAIAASARHADGSWSCDLVAFNTMLLLGLAGRLIGLDGLSEDGRADRLAALYGDLVEGASVEWSARDHAEVLAAALESKEAFRSEFVGPAIEARRRQVRSSQLDLIRVCLEDEDHTWSDEEILRECILYLVAAITTTASLVTHVVDELELWFRDHPEDRNRATDAEFLRNAATEALRLHAPTSALIRRARHAHDFGGISIAGDELVALDLDAANCDRAAFGDTSSSFDPGRSTPRGVAPYGHAFGGGQHLCIGRGLALPSQPLTDDDRKGIAVAILQRLYAEGIRKDASVESEKSMSFLDTYVRYPVRFLPPGTESSEVANHG